MPFNLYPATDVKTPLDIQKQYEEVKSSRLSNMIDDFKLQQAQREQQQQQALINLYQTLGPGLASGDPNALEKLSHVDPTAAQNFQKGALANQSAEQKSQVDMLDLAAKRAAYIGDSAAAVLQAPEAMRPLMYQRALMDAKARNIDISNLPQQYDPAVVQGIMTKALGAKETFDEQLRTAQQQEIERHNVATESLQRAQFGETVRHNKASEANSTFDLGSVPIDPSSQSLLAQTGLSQAAFNALTGATNQPRSQAFQSAVQKEIRDWSIKNGINTATLKSLFQGQTSVLEATTRRNAQANILEGEIQGSVETLAPIADAIMGGSVSAARIADVWSGKQVNDPKAIQYADQLARLRNELAGYNAVASGHLTQQGYPDPRPDDYETASRTILGGISSGGARALAESVSNSAAKNRVVLQREIDDANKAVWDLFGVGKNYKRVYSEPAPTTENAGQNIPRVTNDAEYNNLPAGTVFIGPDGKQRRKP